MSPFYMFYSKYSVLLLYLVVIVLTLKFCGYAQTKNVSLSSDSESTENHKSETVEGQQKGEFIRESQQSKLCFVGSVQYNGEVTVIKLPMAVFPVHPVMWSGLLVLWFLQSAETEGFGSDFCQKLIDGDYENSAGLESDEEPTQEKETFICLLYPTNELNCSWAFDTSETETQLSACISVCGEETLLDSTNCTSVKKAGWMSLALGENIAEVSEVILHLNLYQHNNWTSYTFVYDMDTLELLSPPPNISASFSNGVLTVTWGLPHTRKPINLECFEYELDMCDQEGPKHLVGIHNYTELHADPAQTYSVRMRTRILKKYCSGSLQWSDWSPTVTVPMKLPVSTLSPLVITFICLGIPMILLAVLLFVRYQRVTKILFPPIPRPPLKYKYFLEKSDTFTFFYPATSAKPEEEITQVEDAEKPLERAE